jgi:hypothetical protein
VRRLSVAVVAVLIAFAAFVGGFAADVAWNQRAADLCGLEKEKPPAAANATSYSIEWDWSEFAYICRYRAPGSPTKKVGFRDVL